MLALLFGLGAAMRVGAIQYQDVMSRYSYDSSGYLTFDGRKGDDREYEGRGWNLVSGGDFWALPSGDGNAPPGFPFLIALVYSVTGRHVGALLLLNVLAGGLTAVLTFFLARWLLGTGTAAAAGLLVALDPLLVFTATRALAETITILLTVAVLLAAVEFREAAPSYIRGLCLAVLMACAILTRNQLVAVAGAATLWLMVQPRSWGGRRVVLSSIAACAVLVLVVTAVAARNRPAGSAHQMQQMIAGGYLSPRGYVDVQLDRAARERQGRLSPAEREQVTRTAEAYVDAEPAWQVLALTWYERFRIFWQLEPAVGSTVERFVYTAATTGLFALSLGGLVLWMLTGTSRRDPLTGPGSLLLLTALAVMALHIVVHAKPRYRLPLHPVLSIWAAYALAYAVERLTRVLGINLLKGRQERTAT
jgi:4-amino-4-deoxy-L-arabinose transferase-like glycosyltransferase